MESVFDDKGYTLPACCKADTVNTLNLEVKLIQDTCLLLVFTHLSIYTNKTGDCLFVCLFVCLLVCLSICSLMDGQTARPNGLKFGG